MAPGCCPYLDRRQGCVVAVRLRLCRNGDGWCVTVRDRCCGVVRLHDGRAVPEWTTCTLYEKAGRVIGNGRA